MPGHHLPSAAPFPFPRPVLAPSASSTSATWRHRSSGSCCSSRSSPSASPCGYGRTGAARDHPASRRPNHFPRPFRCGLLHLSDAGTDHVSPGEALDSPVSAVRAELPASVCPAPRVHLSSRSRGAYFLANTSPSARRTDSLPASRSTSLQRRPIASPRRMPVIAMVCHSGERRSSLTASRNALS